jgi:hypothetical protein
VRFYRYQALVNAAGTLAAGELADDASASILPKTIAASVLKRHDATGGVIRIRAHGLTDAADMASLMTLAQAGREKLSTAYEAQVIVGPAGIELLRKSTTLEVAPVERPMRRGQPPRKSEPAKNPKSQP